MENNGGQGEFTYSGQQQPDQLSEPGQVQSQQTSPGGVQWKASEFIDHQKSSLWFVGLIGGALVVSVLVYVITRDILATLVILVAAIAFGMYAGKKPRTLTYSLMPTTLKIDQKTYSYDDFKTFSVIQDGPLFSIILEPVKRFMPPLTIYFAEEDGEQIFDAFAQHLPHEEKKQDFVDQLMKRIRF
jgi:hypothetical protein